MDLSDITIDDFIDVAIMSHGFTPYKRDYFFFIETLWREPLAGQYLILFRHCYDFSYKTIASPDILKQSWDDLFIDFDKYIRAGEPEGYVWGTNHMNSYPGFTLIENSQKAIEWTNNLGKQMQELKVEAEIFKMNLIFHDWTIKKLNSDTNLVKQYIFPLDE